MCLAQGVPILDFVQIYEPTNHIEEQFHRPHYINPVTRRLLKTTKNNDDDKIPVTLIL